jgi:hypothetical protein
VTVPAGARHATHESNRSVRSMTATSTPAGLCSPEAVSPGAGKPTCAQGWRGPNLKPREMIVAQRDLPRTRRARGLVLACVAVATLGGCGEGHAKSDEQQVTQTLKSYLRAQAAGDGQAACGVLSHGAQQQLISLVVEAAKGLITVRPSCQDAVGLVRPLAGAQLLAALENAQVKNVQVHGARATAELLDGTEFHPQQVALEKAGTAWRINGVPSLGG